MKWLKQLYDISDLERPQQGAVFSTYSLANITLLDQYLGVESVSTTE
jgi:hypothetical protein